MFVFIKYVIINCNINCNKIISPAHWFLSLFQIKIQLKIVEMSLAMFGIVANSASETQITNFPSVE